MKLQSGDKARRNNPELYPFAPKVMSRPIAMNCKKRQDYANAVDMQCRDAKGGHCVPLAIPESPVSKAFERWWALPPRPPFSMGVTQSALFQRHKLWFSRATANPHLHKVATFLENSTIELAMNHVDSPCFQGLRRRIVQKQWPARPLGAHRPCT